MTRQLIIRQEGPEDYANIFEVNQKAFGQDNEARLVDALRQNPTVFVPSLSRVAITEDLIVGHILFTKINIEDDSGQIHESLALAPMAVLPEWQRSGIGGQLILNGLEAAMILGFTSVIVLGHEHYYPRFGFVPAAQWNIRAPFDVPADVFMAIELVPDGFKHISGTVIYPKEFEGV